MNIFKAFQQWSVTQARRLVLNTCTKSQYDGITLYAIKDEKEFFEMASKALQMIKEIDLRRYKKVQNHLQSIAYVQMGLDAYIRELHSFFIDTLPKSIESLASSIIHESTHGYLASRGFKYIAEKREQHERICINEELSFLKRVIAQKDISSDKKEEEIKHYKNYFENALKKKWWDTKIQKEKQINRIKSLLFKKYVQQKHYANGCLESEYKIVNGKKNGHSKKFYENGKLRHEGNYANDQMDGPWRWYHEDGQLKSEVPYLNGMMNGTAKIYYPSGKLNSISYYKNDKHDGEWKNFYESGQLECEGIYKEGKKEGLIRYYHENGELKSEE